MAQKDDSPYESATAKLSCCLNVDSRGLVDNVYWLHNNSVQLKSTKDPNHAKFDRCYELTLNSVRFRDSGDYSCVVETNWFAEPLRKKIRIRVRGRPHPPIVISG